jgi:hypothetical protein
VRILRASAASDLLRFLGGLDLQGGNGLANEVLVRGLVNFTTDNLGDEVKDDVTNLGGRFVDGLLTCRGDFVVRVRHDTVVLHLSPTGRLGLDLVSQRLGSGDNLARLLTSLIQNARALVISRGRSSASLLSGLEGRANLVLTRLDGLVEHRQHLLGHDGQDEEYDEQLDKPRVVREEED